MSPATLTPTLSYHIHQSVRASSPDKPSLSPHTDNIKVQYLQFMAYMKTPQYRNNLQQVLEQEKVNGMSKSLTPSCEL